jgi:hypothetical protein
LFSLHTLTTLAGDRIGLSRKSFSRMYLLPFDTSLTRGLSGVVSSISSRAMVGGAKERSNNSQVGIKEGVRRN